MISKGFSEGEGLKELKTLGRLPSSLSTQVGGDHYKKFKIQPVEYIHGNNIPFIEGCIIKYISRWRDKGGIADLNKAKHFINLLIELESNVTDEKTSNGSTGLLRPAPLRPTEAHDQRATGPVRDGVCDAKGEISLPPRDGTSVLGWGS